MKPYVGIFFLFFIACSSAENEQVVLKKPQGFVEMKVPDHNPAKVAGIALGRSLFYDPILSLDSTVSCASCHRQQLAFTDGKPVSTGVFGRQGKRSAPSLANIGFHYKGLFWDGRVASLEEQVSHPIEDTTELGAGWHLALDRLNRHPGYKRAFAKVFPCQGGIDSSQVSAALAQFQRTLISDNSKYDKVMRKQTTFTDQENAGRLIFFDASDSLPFSECGHCHLDPLFTSLDFFNNGISGTEFVDKGRGAVTGRQAEMGMFKTPTLRNVAVTAPYMHDGRFQTLDQVLDHYISGGHYAENVNPNVRKLKFKEGDKQALLAFLYTLTDSTFLTNEAFSNPFQ